MFKLKKEINKETKEEHVAEHGIGALEHFDGHGKRIGINITGTNPIYDHHALLKKKMGRD